MRNKVAISTLILCMGFTISGPVPQGHAETDLDGQVSREAQREGRWKMVTSATMYGFYLYGPGTARLLDIDSTQQIVGLEMLIGGGSFFYSLKATRNYRLGAGNSHLILRGKPGRYPVRIRPTRVLRRGRRQAVSCRGDDRYPGRRTAGSQAQ